MSSDIEKEPLSRQQKKSKETKARIFHAAKTILQKQGYDQFTGHDRDLIGFGNSMSGRITSNASSVRMIRTCCDVSNR